MTAREPRPAGGRAAGAGRATRETRQPTRVTSRQFSGGVFCLTILIRAHQHAHAPRAIRSYFYKCTPTWARRGGSGCVASRWGAPPFGNHGCVAWPVAARARNLGLPDPLSRSLVQVCALFLGVCVLTSPFAIFFCFLLAICFCKGLCFYNTLRVH